MIGFGFAALDMQARAQSGLGNISGLGQAAMNANLQGQALSCYASMINWSGLTTIERMEIDLKGWLRDWDRPKEHK